MATDHAGKKQPDKKPADKKARKSQSSLDEALLRDLDNELLEGAGDLQRPTARPAKADDAEPADAPPVDGEDIGMPSEDADPLARISQEMRQAENLIPKKSAAAPAQKLHQQIIKDLDKLIEQAAKQSAKQGSSQQQKSQKTSQRRLVQQPNSPRPGKRSNKPAQDSTDQLGKAETARPDPQEMKGLMKDAWGHLPPHAREQMLQNSPERFLPQYEVLIERYYKRLAEEQAAK